jgi:TRAP-type C4-dicarboxylate transport system substrate-binding protein
MTAAVFESDSKNDLKILVELAKKLGIRTRYLSAEELEDHIIALKIENGMTTSDVSREQIMQALNK